MSGEELPEDSTFTAFCCPDLFKASPLSLLSDSCAFLVFDRLVQLIEKASYYRSSSVFVDVGVLAEKVKHVSHFLGLEICQK